MLRSRVCEAIGIRYPIFQGGMAWVSDAKLAAAVSNAGGLGIISAMNADENYVRDQIRLCRQLTDAPFGVNIMLMSPHVEAVAQLVIDERVPVVTTGTRSSITSCATASTWGLISMMFTPNGLSVSSRHRRIWSRT